MILSTKALQEDFDEIQAKDPIYTQLPSENAWSLSTKDGIIGIVGYSPFWGSTETLWAIVSPKASKYGIRFVKECIRLIDTHTKGERLQAFVDPKIEENVRFIKLLGFHKESTMVKGSPSGEDIDLYVRIK